MSFSFIFGKRHSDVKESSNITLLEQTPTQLKQVEGLAFYNEQAYTQVYNIGKLMHYGAEAASEGQYEAATAHFRSALHLDPQNIIALMWLGYLSQDVIEAIGYYDAVLRLNPSNSTARHYFQECISRAAPISMATGYWKPKELTEKIKTPVSTLPWLGQLFLEDGIINRNQLNTALERQEALAFGNKWKPLGEVLLQLGFIKRVQLDKVLTIQKERRAQYL